MWKKVTKFVHTHTHRHDLRELNTAVLHTFCYCLLPFYNRKRRLDFRAKVLHVVHAEKQEMISRGRSAQETVEDREQSGTPGRSLNRIGRNAF